MRDASGNLAISLKRRRWITSGLLLGMSLGALEATVVSTAMPTVVASLGGLEHYSWVFSAYLLTSTRSEEHTSELQSQSNLVCRLLLEKKKKKETPNNHLKPDDLPLISQRHHDPLEYEH